MYLSVELVCSSAGQSVAFPPTADPCQTCVGDEGAPEGTHSPAAAKIKIIFHILETILINCNQYAHTWNCFRVENIIQYYSQYNMLNMERNKSADLFFSCNFNGSGGNLRKQGGKNEVTNQLMPCLLSSGSVIIRLKYLHFGGNYFADRFSHFNN